MAQQQIPGGPFVNQPAAAAAAQRQVPGGRFVNTTSGAPPPATFNPAWAISSNAVIGAGAMA